MLQNQPVSVPQAVPSQPNQIRAYFNQVLSLYRSGEPFPVNLDDVWPRVYATKGNAIKVLQKEFMEGVDFNLIQNDKVLTFPELQNGVKYDVYLSLPCLEFFYARKIREVFEVYRQVFHKAVAPAPALPQTYAEALRQLAEKVESEERLRRENEELKPKAHATEILLTATETISIGNYAKVIGWGQNRLFEQMRKDKYLIPSGEGYNLPYQQFIDRGYFEVIETTYVRTAGTIIHKQPRITPKGQVYFATKYGRSAEKGGEGHA